MKFDKEKQITIDNETKKIGSRSKLEKIMNDFKIDLISRIRPILSQRSSELFRTITNGKYPSMELDEDYNIRIEDEGNTFTTDRFSGGEEDLANLCLRIAISQELAERSGGMQSNFIALDEIFGSQDEERKNNILKALSELSNQFRQILVITHVEDVKETLPYVLTVKETSENSVKIEAEGILPTVT
jgi:DNA repair protein SbcC/Rad50